jgi:hypothetical protein
VPIRPCPRSRYESCASIIAGRLSSSLAVLLDQIVRLLRGPDLRALRQQAIGLHFTHSPMRSSVHPSSVIVSGGWGRTFIKRT